MKIAVLGFTVSKEDDQRLTNAIGAVVAPFACLKGVDIVLLRKAMADYADAEFPSRRRTSAQEVIKVAWSGIMHGLPVVELGRGIVRLRVEDPFAEISLHRNEGILNLEVFFGDIGSTNRAKAILRKAEELGVLFATYDTEGRSLSYDRQCAFLAEDA